MSIYVLELSNSKYYVGLSDNPDQRIAKHLSGRGSSWTQKHKPTGRYRIIHNGDNPYNLKETTESTTKNNTVKVRDPVPENKP